MQKSMDKLWKLGVIYGRLGLSCKHLGEGFRYYTIGMAGDY